MHNKNKNGRNFQEVRPFAVKIAGGLAQLLLQLLRGRSVAVQ
jgi:hypothetical protein